MYQYKQNSAEMLIALPQCMGVKSARCLYTFTGTTVAAGWNRLTRWIKVDIVNTMYLITCVGGSRWQIATECLEKV